MEDGFHSNHVLEAVSPGERTTMRAELERGRKEGRKEGDSRNLGVLNNAEGAAFHFRQGPGEGTVTVLLSL